MPTEFIITSVRGTRLPREFKTYSQRAAAKHIDLERGADDVTEVKLKTVKWTERTFEPRKAAKKR